MFTSIILPKRPLSERRVAQIDQQTTARIREFVGQPGGEEHPNLKNLNSRVHWHARETMELNELFERNSFGGLKKTLFKKSPLDESNKFTKMMNNSDPLIFPIALFGYNSLFSSEITTNAKMSLLTYLCLKVLIYRLALFFYWITNFLKNK